MPEEDRCALFVIGAHLAGEPLNHQLIDLGGALVSAATTAPLYRMFALPGSPARPGLLRVATSTPGGIEGEIFALSPDAFGRFVQKVIAPLAIGKIELGTGALVCGFLCESYATVGCPDITGFGSWRRYRRTAAVTGGS